MGELKSHFRPEFLNRLDDVIMFHSLERAQIERIVEFQLGLVAERLEKKELTLEVSAGAQAKLAESGFDPLYGARPLKRLVQREVVDRIAKAVLEGRLQRGDVIRVDVRGDVLVVEPLPSPEATQARAQA